MKRTKLKDRKLPTYTKGEEIFNMVSHIVGASIGIVVITLCVVLSILHQNIYGLISSIVYGVSIILLYTMSSIYHGLKSELLAKKVFQIIDHCSIFVLIAGTYTPILLCKYREYDAMFAYGLLAFMWLLTIIGIVLNSIDLKKYSKFSMLCYLGMGWTALIRADLMPKLLTTPGFVLILLGGIAYTIGALCYGLGRKRKWMHSIFHVACIIGTLLHAICILIYVI